MTYEVQSKKRNSDLREGWTAYQERYSILHNAVEAMAQQAEANPELMHRVVQKVDRVVAIMPELDTSCHPQHERWDT